MQIAMIGLGRMGSNMVRKLLRASHECVVFNRSRQPVEDLARENAIAAADLGDVVNKLKTPRALWLMIPAAVIDRTIAKLMGFLDPGDILTACCPPYRGHDAYDHARIGAVTRKWWQ